MPTKTARDPHHLLSYGGLMVMIVLSNAWFLSQAITYWSR
jgi:hypothetical protein